MVYITDNGRVQDTRRYSIKIGPDNYEAIIPDQGNVVIKMDGNKLEDDLVAMALDDLRTQIPHMVNPDLVTRANHLLDRAYSGPQPFEPEVEETPPAQLRLPAPDREKIKGGFTEWSGGPSRSQKKILDEYGLEYDPRNHGNYGRIRRKSDGNFVSVSSTPRNKGAAGTAIARDLITILLKPKE